MKEYTDKLKHSLKTGQEYVNTHRKQFAIGGGATLVLAVIVALFVYNTVPKIDYQPVVACNWFTQSKAKELLGSETLQHVSDPVITKDVATSSCSYSDMNASQDAMIVAAVAIRTGVNDKGVEQNKTEFEGHKSNHTIETVTGVGTEAYFDHTLGQLNILQGHEWIMISYGVGSTPKENTVTDAVKLAQKILP